MPRRVPIGLLSTLCLVSLVVVYLTQLIPARGVDDHATLRALLSQAIED